MGNVASAWNLTNETSVGLPTTAPQSPENDDAAIFSNKVRSPSMIGNFTLFCWLHIIYNHFIQSESCCSICYLSHHGRADSKLLS